MLKGPVLRYSFQGPEIKGKLKGLGIGASGFRGSGLGISSRGLITEAASRDLCYGYRVTQGTLV